MGYSTKRLVALLTETLEKNSTLKCNGGVERDQSFFQ
jgi:hypothetical protein